MPEINHNTVAKTVIAGAAVGLLVATGPVGAATLVGAGCKAVGAASVGSTTTLVLGTGKAVKLFALAAKLAGGKVIAATGAFAGVALPPLGLVTQVVVGAGALYRVSVFLAEIPPAVYTYLQQKGCCTTQAQIGLSLGQIFKEAVGSGTTVYVANVVVAMSPIIVGGAVVGIVAFFYAKDKYDQAMRNSTQPLPDFFTSLDDVQHVFPSAPRHYPAIN